MASLFVGAALGPPFQMVFDYVFKNPLEKGLAFNDKRKFMEKKLRALDSVIKALQESNMVLDRPISEMGDFVQVLEQGNKLVGQCSNVSQWCYAPIWPRYTTKLLKLDESINELLNIVLVHTARDVKQILILLNAILDRMGRPEFNDLAFRQVEVELEGGWAVPEAPDYIVGLDKPLEKLKMELLKGDRSVLVVTAPGGGGKTTLAKKLCQDGEIKGRFKSIMFVRVSERPDLNRIVQELYQYSRKKKPDLLDEEDAFIWLERLLREIGQNNPMLLVLDDVWSVSQSLVEKLKFNIPNYKILVTSRLELPKFKPAYKLDVLDDGDAINLFRHHASLDDGSYDIPEELEKKVVHHCKRFPLALKLIGSTLCGRPRDIMQIELENWLRDSSVLESEADLLRCLKRSLDVLVEKDTVLKECFMDLGSFPEGCRIPATALIDMWTELHGLQEHYAIPKLSHLNNWNLANVVVTRKDTKEADGYYSEHFVTQHDMLRELAIHQSKQNLEGQTKRLIVELTESKLPKWWKEHNDQPFDANLVAISTDGSFSSEWCDLKLPKAKVLVLNVQTKTHALPKFLKNMSELKVMIITNYGFFPAEISDFQLLESLTNLTRIRLERISIPSLKEPSVVLKKLQKLSLFMCEIGQAFISIKISEVLPNLVEIYIDYCSNLVELPAGLCDLIYLKNLSITHCHNLSALPEEIGNLVNLELLRLRSCIDLEKLPDSICNLSKLTFLDISDCFGLQKLPEHIGELHSLTKLNMKDCSRLQDLPPSVLDFKQLKCVVCDEELKELWEFYLPTEANIELRSIKDEVNLNWLENHHF